jgi:hypothetical protein
MRIKVVVLLLTSFLSSGCSVYMAAKGNNGTDLDEVTECKTRGCLIAAGADPIGAKEDEDGHLTSETFKIIKPTGSAARAAMHGVLDLATFGIWEIAGTPIEGYLGKDKSIAIRVNYEEDRNTIESISIEQ